MDDDVPSEASGGDGEEDRRRSRDVSRHFGFITTLVARWNGRGHFRGLPFDELKHIAIIEADRLLRDKYDPELATVSSFFSSYLFSRVEYAVGTSQGRRKRREGWIAITDLDPPARQREPPPEQATDLEDLIRSIHPDFRDICRRLAEGETLDEIIDEMAASPLFNSLKDSDLESSRSDLLTMLQAATRHLL
tara:strand:- start:526 stop:1101 length:576 start_codon:yes stop_codon:yes gene_type:complete